MLDYSELYIGKQVNYLTIISTQIRHNDILCHECLCVCGTKKIIGSRSLLKNMIKSCGCAIAVETVKRTMKRAIRSKYFPLWFLSQFKIGAKKRDIEWNLTIEDLDIIYERQNGKCYYSDDELILPSHRTKTYSKTHYNVSIDRIDNGGGYTLDNVRLCTKQVNYCKHILSDNDFIKLCNKITKKHSQQFANCA